MRTESHGIIEHPNLLLLLLNRQTICRFSKIQLITSIRLLVQRRKERFGWKKFLLLVFVPSSSIVSLSFELNPSSLFFFFLSPLSSSFCVSLTFFSKNDMFCLTRKLSAVMLLVTVPLVLGLEKRRLKDLICDHHDGFGTDSLFFKNLSR